MVPEWLRLGAPPSAHSPAWEMGNAYENGFLLRLEGQQLGLALLLAQDSGRFFDPLEILLADDEGCCRVLHGDAGGEGHGKGVSLAPSILQPPPCPPGLAVGAARAVRGQESPPSNAGSTRAVASPVAPVLPVGGGKERNRKCSESCGGARGTGCAAGQGPPGKTPKPSFSTCPASPHQTTPGIFQANPTGLSFGESVTAAPTPFSSGASCSSLTVAGPERRLEASALGSSSCLLALLGDTRHSLGLAPLPQEFARHERRKRRGRVPSQRCQVPLQLRSSLTQRATNPARDSRCGLEEIAEAPGAPISPCVKMWIITRGCFPREG